MRVLMIAAVGFIAGWGGGEAPEPAAVKTPAPTATATATVAKASPAERAKAELQNYLGNETRGTPLCIPADELPVDTLAAVDCEYRDGPRGSYWLFETRKAMKAFYMRVRKTGDPITGTACSSYTWHGQGGRTQGNLGVFQLRDRVMLIWTDDRDRVLGTIRSKTASPRTLCAIWRDTF